MTYQEIKKNEEVCAFLQKGNENLGMLGYTDHSSLHCTLVAKRAACILEKFGYSEDLIELARIAGFMHDIGNVVNRSRHAEYGAILANEILKETDMSLKDRITVVSAIGHHDESTGGATDPISAALIIADKTDVRRNRVRNKAKENFDIHDRWNYAVTDAQLVLDEKQRKVMLKLTIDTKLCPVLDYFEIFMQRTMMSKYAAKYLKVWFELVINGTKLL